MEDILKYVRSVIYETDTEGYEEALSGTCFPIYWEEELFIVMAKHCFTQSLQEDPSRFFYFLHEEENDAVRAEQYFQMKNVDNTEDKYHDIIILKVNVLPPEIQDTSNIKALGISLPSSISSLDDFIQNNTHAGDVSKKSEGIIIRGFPFATKRVNYDENKVILQGVRLESCISVKRSEYTQCYYLKFNDPTFFESSEKENTDDPANGLSGSPVFYYDNQTNKLLLLGMVIGYNSYTDSYLVISSLVIQKFLQDIKNKQNF